MISSDERYPTGHVANECSLTMRECRVLCVLAERGGTSSRKDIAAALDRFMSAATVREIICRLNQMGLVHAKRTNVLTARLTALGAARIEECIHRLGGATCSQVAGVDHGFGN